MIGPSALGFSVYDFRRGGFALKGIYDLTLGYDAANRG